MLFWTNATNKKKCIRWLNDDTKLHIKWTKSFRVSHPRQNTLHDVHSSVVISYQGYISVPHNSKGCDIQRNTRLWFQCKAVHSSSTSHDIARPAWRFHNNWIEGSFSQKDMWYFEQWKPLLPNKQFIPNGHKKTVIWNSCFSLNCDSKHRITATDRLTTSAIAVE